MELIKCPYCKMEIENYSIWCRFCLRVIDNDYKLNCPACSEPILKTDFYCRFCNTKLRTKQVTRVVKDDNQDDDGLSGSPVRVPPKGSPPSLHNYAQMILFQNGSGAQE